MRVFNRIVVVLLLAGLFALGVFTLLAASEPLLDRVGLEVTDLQDLPGASRPDNLFGGLESYFTNIESGYANGDMGLLDLAILGGVVLLGLILLVLELKPRRPRRVRMQSGTYVTRNAVEDAVAEAAERDPELLRSNVSIKAQRRPGAKVGVRASVRQGEDVGSLQSGARDRIQQHLDQVGIPVGNLKVRVTESDPHETKTRVR